MSDIKRQIEVYSEEPMDECLSESCGSDRQRNGELLLEEVINENPLLTGKECIELYETKRKLKRLEYKADVAKRFEELQLQKGDKYYKLKDEISVSYFRITSYRLEHDTIYVDYEKLCFNKEKRAMCPKDAILLKNDWDNYHNFFENPNFIKTTISAAKYHKAVNMYNELKDLMR